jgi:hypothetical protein
MTKKKEGAMAPLSLKKVTTDLYDEKYVGNFIFFFYYIVKLCNCLVSLFLFK